MKEIERIEHNVELIVNELILNDVMSEWSVLDSSDQPAIMQLMLRIVSIIPPLPFLKQHDHHDHRPVGCHKACDDSKKCPDEAKCLKHVVRFFE